MTPQAFAGSPPATSRVAPTTRFGRVRRPARPAAPPRTCLTPINPLEARGGGAWLPAPKTNGPPPDRGRAVVLACVGWGWGRSVSATAERHRRQPWRKSIDAGRQRPALLELLRVAAVGGEHEGVLRRLRDVHLVALPEVAEVGLAAVADHLRVGGDVEGDRLVGRLVGSLGDRQLAARDRIELAAVLGDRLEVIAGLGRHDHLGVHRRAADRAPRATGE